MKKKMLLLFILCGLFGGYSNAQTYLILVKKKDSKTWQYANLKGEIVIDRKDPLCYEFSEDGIAVVDYSKQNLNLFINTKGEEIPTEIKDYKLKGVFGYGLKGYSNGLVVVQQKNKFGCLDVNGKIAIPLKYDDLTEFDNGYGIGKIGSNFYVVSQDGKEVLVKLDNIKEIKHFQEGLAPIVSIGGSFGFIDTNGKVVISGGYSGAGYFNNGLAWARTTEKLVGFINQKGEWEINPKFSVAKDFDKESGMAMVKYEEKWVYVNQSGKIISFDISSTTKKFSEGLSEGKKGNLIGFYNNKGAWVIQPQFEDARRFRNGFAVVKSKGLWGVIDKEGNWIMNPTFEEMKDVILIK